MTELYDEKICYIGSYFLQKKLTKLWIKLLFDNDTKDEVKFFRLFLKIFRISSREKPFTPKLIKKFLLHVNKCAWQHDKDYNSIKKIKGIRNKLYAKHNADLIFQYKIKNFDTPINSDKLIKMKVSNKLFYVVRIFTIPYLLRGAL